ncbi:hypothetical protein AB0Q95_06910 [Streptomyces sp. NPDC059900]|uniref:hypothetical protein n=1 Tax=Streptomyces sp. NPDC059900 TaxID=3155816 RepID=UPI00343C59AF
MTFEQFLQLYESAEHEGLWPVSESDTNALLRRIHAHLDPAENIVHVIRFQLENGMAPSFHPRKNYDPAILVITSRRLLLFARPQLLVRAVEKIKAATTGGGPREEFHLSEMLLSDLTGTSGIRNPTSFGLTRNVVLHQAGGRMVKIAGMGAKASERTEAALRSALESTPVQGKGGRAAIEACVRRGNTELAGGSQGTPVDEVLDLLVDHLDGESPVHVAAFQDAGRQRHPWSVLTLSPTRLIHQLRAGDEELVDILHLGAVSNPRWGKRRFMPAYLKLQHHERGEVAFYAFQERVVADLGAAIKQRLADLA